MRARIVLVAGALLLTTAAPALAEETAVGDPCPKGFVSVPIDGETFECVPEESHNIKKGKRRPHRVTVAKPWSAHGLYLFATSNDRPLGKDLHDPVTGLARTGHGPRGQAADKDRSVST